MDRANHLAWQADQAGGRNKLEEGKDNGNPEQHTSFSRGGECLRQRIVD